MNQFSPPSRNIEFSLNQGLAYIIGVPTLLLCPMLYWQYDSALFGSSGLAKLFLICAAGGAVSFALFAGRRRWLAGALLGLAAGAGAAGAHVLYTGISHRTTLHGKESVLVCLVGAGLPLALLATVLKRDKEPPKTDGQPD
jgi:hypothetical protein